MTGVHLQLALDVVDLGMAIDFARDLAPYVDRIEVGTPLILNHGMAAVAAIRACAPSSVVVADLKIMDVGETLTSMALDSGADGVIVQAAAPRQTLSAACRSAGRRHGFVMVDTLGVGQDLDLVRRRTKGLPVDHLILHTGKDEQRHGLGPGADVDPDVNLSVIAGAPPLAVAGGIDELNVQDALRMAPFDLVIVGESVYAARDPREALLRIKRQAAARSTEATCG